MGCARLKHILASMIGFYLQRPKEFSVALMV
jgi:hypothetical protein